MATSKTSLKVLYVGGSADVETFGMVDVDSAVVAKSKAQRMASWKSYLETYFTTVKAIPSSEYNYKMSDDYDVTIPIYYVDDWEIDGLSIDAVPLSIVIDGNGVVYGNQLGQASYDWMDDTVNDAIESTK